MMKRKFVAVNKLKYAYYCITAYFNYLIEQITTIPPDNYKKIPIIINNFNRLVMLKSLIASLEQRGYSNIYIIDNCSTYPPLLEYYKSAKYNVFFLERNIGMKALWISGIYKRFKNNYFVYTDPDILPIVECPDDFLLHFLEIFKKHKLARKIGFSIKIDDLPECNLLKDEIISCEGGFFDYPENESLYRAPIATTFALYRPYGKINHANNYIKIYRTAFPYMARHLPWYSDYRNPDDEERYYLEHSTLCTYWSSRCVKLMHKKKVF
jgi:hypothetical protein